MASGVRTAGSSRLPVWREDELDGFLVEGIAPFDFELARSDLLDSDEDLEGFLGRES
jgi:hypothetical protein